MFEELSIIRAKGSIDVEQAIRRGRGYTIYINYFVDKNVNISYRISFSAALQGFE